MFVELTIHILIQRCQALSITPLHPSVMFILISCLKKTAHLPQVGYYITKFSDSIYIYNAEKTCEDCRNTSIFICSQWITCSMTDNVTYRNVMTEWVQDLNTHLRNLKHLAPILSLKSKTWASSFSLMCRLESVDHIFLKGLYKCSDII